MLEYDIPKEMPVTPVLHRVADFLDAYNFSVGVRTEFHAGPNDGDVTEFCVYAVQPADNVLHGRRLMARIDTGKRRPLFYLLRDFDGKIMKQKLHAAAFQEHMTKMGDRLEAAGQPRSRFNEYVDLVHTYDTLRETYITSQEAIDVMRLPLRLFDLGQILSYRSDLIPELMQYANMPRSYLENLFDVENLREQDTVYKTMKKYGHLPRLS